MVKSARPDSPLAAAIRAAVRRAGKKGGGLEGLREKTGLSTGTFYGILAGYRAQQNPSTPTLQKLASAGVKIPATLIPVFRSAA